MIKKTKIFGIFIPTTLLVPFSLLPVSCGKTKIDSATDSSNSENGNNDSNKTTISEEIKDFIKKGVLPEQKQDTDQSILVISNLVDTTDSRKKKMESDKIEASLNQLASNLNKNSDETKIELKDNKIVEDALKKIIYNNCKTTSELLRTNFSSEFGELASDKILEIDENGLFFNLKPFGIDKILRDIGYNENESNIKIADSQALKIYKFSTDLKVIVNTNGGKKVQLPINDLNLFVVSDREQVVILKKGISDYLKEKFANDTISLYLDGDELTGQSNSEINEHFIEILKWKNYNLIDNDNNKEQTMSYLANKYLPKLIYKKPNQSTQADQQEIPIKIDSKNLTFISETDNFLKDGMEMSEPLRQKINFLNFFGKNSNVRQINDTTVNKEIKPEHFLKHKKIHPGKISGQYYSLGSGIFNINEWSIRGFQISPINVNFEIFINCEVLGKEVRNLQICLNHLLDVMSKSSIEKKYVNGDRTTEKFALKIVWPKASFPAINSQLESDRNSEGLLPEWNRILTMIFIEPAKEKATSNFSSEILKNISFELKFNTSKESNKSNNEKLEVYFIFNSSFKIKLSNEFFYNILDKETEIDEPKSSKIDLRALKNPVSTVVISATSDSPAYSGDSKAVPTIPAKTAVPDISEEVKAFKVAIIAALQTGDFVNLNVSDVDIEKVTGGVLLPADIPRYSTTIAFKIKAKPESANFTGEKTLTINRSKFSSKIALEDLEAPVSIVKSADNDASAFKTALISALQIGKFATLALDDVEIKKENGDALDNNYIGDYDSLTVQIVAKKDRRRFTGTRILKIERLAKLKTAFHIS